MTDNRPGATEAIGWLADRARTAARIGSRWGSLLDGTRPTWVTGAGGSYPAADFIARALRHHAGVFAQPVLPLDLADEQVTVPV